MYTTKPSSKDFDDYVDEQFDNIVQNEKTDIHQLLNSGINKTLAFQLKQSKKYNDKLLFAFVTARELDREVKFVGWMGMWFSISK